MTTLSIVVTPPSNESTKPPQSFTLKGTGSFNLKIPGKEHPQKVNFQSPPIFLVIAQRVHEKIVKSIGLVNIADFSIVRKMIGQVIGKDSTSKDSKGKLKLLMVTDKDHVPAKVAELIPFCDSNTSLNIKFTDRPISYFFYSHNAKIQVCRPEHKE